MVGCGTSGCLKSSQNQGRLNLDVVIPAFAGMTIS